jgi:hypothetical protein
LLSGTTPRTPQTETAAYTDGTVTVEVGDVTLTTAGERITAISITKDSTPVDDYSELINEVIADNGVDRIVRPLTLSEQAVAAAISRILTAIRSSVTEAGAGSCFYGDNELQREPVSGQLQAGGQPEGKRC